MNLAELAERSAERLGEHVTLDFEGERFTNWELLRRARRLQTALESLGLGPGRVAALFMVNHPIIYPIFQGIFRSGAAAVPIMFQLTVPELRYILEDTEAALVLTDAQLLPKVREAVERLPTVRHVVVRGGESLPERQPPELSLQSLLEADERPSLPDIHDDALALMLYTSGTTGKPKGVMLAHANLIASAEAANHAAELDRWEGPRIAMSAMPMAHIFGVGVMNSGYLIPDRLAGAYSVQMRWFEPEGFMALIQRQGCTTMAAVPTMLAMILNHPNVEAYDLSSLKEVVCGAAPLPVELARAFMDRYACRVREIYGMTENTGIGSANRLSEPYRPGSAGRPYFNTEVRIVDDAGRTVPAGARGEIVTRGPTTMKGYHKKPEATTEAVRDGWLHTGDIGYFDAEGYLYIVDRKKDMIIRGGENIYPAEVEDALYAHPAVAEAAVVGVPDPIYGEAVVAFVVPRRQPKVEEAELIEFVRGRITKFKAPERVFFLEALPKAGVGKILRRELREMARRAMAPASSGGR